MDQISFLLLGIFPVLAIVAGLNDLTTMRIPNWISLALIAGFFPTALLIGVPFVDMASSVGVGLLALVVGMIMFALGWVGGGDAKLLAVSCLWMGLAGAGEFLLSTAMIGGFFCLILLMARHHLGSLTVFAPAWVERLMEPKGDIPYGVAIAAGAMIAYPSSDLIVRFIG